MAMVMVSALVDMNAEAYTISHTDNMIWNVTDLYVNGTPYNVDFIYGSYFDVYGSGFDFTSYSAASDAAEALKAAINSYDYTPASSIPGSLYDECTSHASSQGLIPYRAFGAEDIESLSACGIYNSGSVWNGASWSYYDPTANVMYARFSTVPIPTTFLLLGAGLAGMAGFRKKFKKT